MTISSDIAIAISPATSSVELGSTQAFQASRAHLNSSEWLYPGPLLLIVPQFLRQHRCERKLHRTTNSAECDKFNDYGNQCSGPVEDKFGGGHSDQQFHVADFRPTSLAMGAKSAIVATMTPVPGSHPDGALAWNLSGTGCNGNACGILAVTTTQSAGAGSFADTASYTAPQTSPQPNTVTITVTPAADGTKKAVTNIAIQSSSGGSIGLSPITATLAANHRTTLTVSESGVTGSLNWSVNGIAGGSSTLGQICAVGSSPCQSISSGTSQQVDYVTPGAIPSPNPISELVSSATNPQINASTQVTVINHILVSVQPNNVIVSPLGDRGSPPAYSERPTRASCGRYKEPDAPAASAAGLPHLATTLLPR